MTNSFPQRRSSDLKAQLFDELPGFLVCRAARATGTGQAQKFRHHVAAKARKTPDYNIFKDCAFPEQLQVLERTGDANLGQPRSEEHTSELQSLMRISYAVFFLKIQKPYQTH